MKQNVYHQVYQVKSISNKKKKIFFEEIISEVDNRKPSVKRISHFSKLKTIVLMTNHETTNLKMNNFDVEIKCSSYLKTLSF